MHKALRLLVLVLIVASFAAGTPQMSGGCDYVPSTVAPC